MKMKTLATVLYGPGNIGVEDRELQVGPEDVLVRTHLAGICGTDKNIYQGRLPRMTGPGYGRNASLVTFPYYTGHEGGGVVEAVGSRVKAYRPGDFVMSFDVNGTMAEYFVADEQKLEPAPTGLSPDLACLGEAIACAMFAGLHSRVNPGDTVAVFGLGFAGQIIAQAVKQKGAHLVIGLDIVDRKLSTARDLGADVTINALHEDPLDRILELTNGVGADVVVEAAGNEQTINQSIASVRHNGALIFYSWVTQDVTVNISRLHHDSLTVINTGLVHHTTAERTVWTPWCLRPVVQGAVRIDSLVNRRFALEEAKEAFRVDSEDPDAIKTVLVAV